MESLYQQDKLENTQQQAAAMNPPHTDTTKIPWTTPWDVRLGLTLLPARYVLRGLIQTWTSPRAPEWLQAATGIHWVENHRAKPILDSVNTLYSQHKPDIQALFHGENVFSLSSHAIFTRLTSSPAGRELIEQNRAIHEKHGLGNYARDNLKFAIRNHLNGPFRLTEESSKRIRDIVTSDMFEVVYDNALGLGSLGMAYHIRRNVLSDMHSVYSEAVGFELNKDPSEVTEDDIFNSGNQIIQSTVKNFNRNQKFRFGISAIPFLKNIRPMRFAHLGDMAVGAWAAMWAFDIWGREPTMLENFMNFINDKLNPLYGISDPIKSSDIINMYQQYAFRFAPERAFRSISVNDEDSNVMWAQSEKIFVRIAELMNESYNFKHTTRLDPETRTPVSSADFTMPKFIYLLGHGLINTRRPEWSMAFIEIANAFDMEAVKEAAKAFHDGAPLEQVLQKYPVNLNPNGHVNGISRPVLLAAHSQPVLQTPAATVPLPPPHTQATTSEAIILPPESAAHQAQPVAQAPTAKPKNQIDAAHTPREAVTPLKANTSQISLPA